jgi:hypothetical protein
MLKHCIGCIKTFSPFICFYPISAKNSLNAVRI